MIEFAYSLPNEARREGRLYRAMLLGRFGTYFRSIPYAMEGVPISVPHVLTRARAKLLRLKARLCGGGNGGATGRRMAEYAGWMRREPARSFIDGLLTAKDAMYGEHVDAAEALQTWSRHLWGADHTSAVMRLVTLELWLQQVFAGRYRSSQSDEAAALLRRAA